MMRYARCLMVAVIALVVTAGCGTQASSTQPKQTAGSLSAEFVVSPNPPVPMQEALLELRLSDTQGQPIMGARVAFDLTMPGMQMPPNRPEGQEMESGVYRAPALFTMAGRWQVQATVARDQTSQTFVFDLRTR